MFGIFINQIAFLSFSRSFFLFLYSITKLIANFFTGLDRKLINLLQIRFLSYWIKYTLYNLISIQCKSMYTQIYISVYIILYALCFLLIFLSFFFLFFLLQLGYLNLLWKVKTTFEYRQNTKKKYIIKHHYVSLYFLEIIFYL